MIIAAVSLLRWRYIRWPDDPFRDWWNVPVSMALVAFCFAGDLGDALCRAFYRLRERR
jgi:hypothetical protein